jgi:hypothetical protein
MNNNYFSGMADAYKAALHKEIESYCFQLENGEILSVGELVDEANAARADKKGKKVKK